jgi:enoyl-CoA hydratase/carnithine racemase
MLLLAEMISASELLKQGYLLKICEPQDLDQAIDTLVERLTSLAPLTQKSTKLMLARQIANQASDCQDLISETYASNDFKHGVASFLSGVAPRWTGK